MLHLTVMADARLRVKEYRYIAPFPLLPPQRLDPTIMNFSAMAARGLAA